MRGFIKYLKYAKEQFLTIGFKDFPLIIKTCSEKIDKFLLIFDEIKMRLNSVDCSKLLLIDGFELAFFGLEDWRELEKFFFVVHVFFKIFLIFIIFCIYFCFYFEGFYEVLLKFIFFCK